MPRPQLIRRREAEPEKVTGTAVPYVTTFEYMDRPDHLVTHKSMAPDWARALELAARAVRQDEIVGLEVIPRFIRVERG